MKEDTVRQKLKRLCAESGGQLNWARAHGLPPSYVCEVISGRRPVGKVILAALSLTKVIDYRKAES